MASGPARCVRNLEDSQRFIFVPSFFDALVRGLHVDDARFFSSPLRYRSKPSPEMALATRALAAFSVCDSMKMLL